MHGDFFPSYSDDGLSARDIFYSEFNENLFYVEDEEQENLYLEILSKLFPDLTIDQIFPLGGKDSVIRHLNDPANEINIKKSIYIVDKDFDDILDKKIINDRLFYLDKYSIENYLLESNAVIGVIVEECPKIKKINILDDLNFSNKYNEFVLSLADLVKVFVLVQKEGLTLKNTSYNIERFTKNKKQYEIDFVKVGVYKQEVFKEMKIAGVISCLDDFEFKIKSIMLDDFLDLEKNVCGKHILSMVMHFMGEFTGKGCIEKDSLSFRLAKNCEFISLLYLRDKIRMVL